MWENSSGDFGQEGDATTLWIGVTHPDFAPRVFSAEGVLSDESNLVATIRLETATFSVAQLSGRVVDSNGAGVNGVRVVLDLPVVGDATNEPEDDVAQTATVDGVTGTFVFAPVEWSEANAGEESNGEIDVTVRVTDDNWEAAATRQVRLVPDPTIEVETEQFSVVRKARTEFSTTVTGRLFERIGTAPDVQNVPVQGVRVELQYVNAGGTPNPVVLVDHTDDGGVYEFTVTWTDPAPGDFDDAGTDSDAGDADTSIPAGEDGLEVDLAYTSVDRTPSAAGGELLFATANTTDYRITSNPRDGSNRVTDLVRTETP